MRKYKVIGNPASFEADNDQTAALVVAALGDFGFTDRNGMELFPACWDTKEFESYLGRPLDAALRDKGPEVASIVNNIRK